MSWPGSRCCTATSVELAVGHGVGVEGDGRTGRAGSWGTAARRRRCRRRRCRAPTPPGPIDFAEPAIREPFTAALPALDMQTLSRGRRRRSCPELLSPLADAYEAWIDAQERRIDDPAGASRGP